MKIAFISNFTVNTIANACENNLKVQVYVPHGFNVWAEELLNPESGLYKFFPDIVFMLIDGDSLGEDFVAVNHECERILGIIKESIKNHPNIFFVVNTLDITTLAAKMFVVSGVEQASSILELWDSGLAKAGVGILDMRNLVARFGRDHVYSKKFWYLGGMKFSPQGERFMTKEVSRIVNAFSGKTRKCLIIDLDNTLWGGIVGEDGVSGILLSKTAEGSAYRDFQKEIKALKSNGVMLAIVSKNNEADVVQVFNEHVDMVLTLSDFVARRINWCQKSENIESIAKELNIGLDSIVFIDDSPFEREQVKAALPEVIAPDFPQDSALLPQWIIDVARDFFLKIAITEEDRQKTQMYIAESERNKEKQQFASFEEYLTSLAMELCFKEIETNDVVRAAQLTQKTNQFNLTVRRYSETDIKKISLDNNWKIYLGELSDKFGSYGKVLLVMVAMEGKTARIDEFLMSCRVMSRNVEFAMLNAVENELRNKGMAEIQAEYVPSAKNNLVKDFWESAGYALVNEKSDGKKTYKIELSRLPLRKTFVKTIKEKKDE